MVTAYISALKADTKNIFRDSSLIMMLFVPFLFIPLVRFGGKALVDYFPIIAEYSTRAVVLLGAVVAVFPAFVMGFVMMDEKDGGLNQVLRILPFSINKLIGLRVGLMITIGLINSLLFFAFNGIVFLNFYKMLILSINVTLFAPISAFLMLCISSNKIEAAAVLKGISFVTFIAFLQFFIPNGLKYVLSAIPSFWAYRSFEVIENNFLFIAFSLSGILIQMAYLAILWKYFLKKW